MPRTVLILGGTRFLGHAIRDAALGRGDQVTLFNRGLSGADLYPGMEKIIGDHTGDLSALAGRDWDVVVDVAAYDPAVVGRDRGEAGGCCYRSWRSGAEIRPADGTPHPPRSFFMILGGSWPTGGPNGSNDHAE
jgi:NAD(P)-dependent dehydrogenase (short-subunit alcohol dehydrogenase family)